MNFLKNPEVFVSVNQYTITYGNKQNGENDEAQSPGEGTLIKKTIRWNSD